jgi:hypothetical protein
MSEDKRALPVGRIEQLTTTTPYPPDGSVTYFHVECPGCKELRAQLAAARAEGRAEGLREAAGIAEHDTEWLYGPGIEVREEYSPAGKRIAAAIRSRGEGQP